MSVPDYVEMGREMAENRDEHLVGAANRGVKCREELERAEKYKQWLQELLNKAVDIIANREIERDKWKASAAAAECKLAAVITECSLYPKHPLVHREKILALAQSEQPQEQAK